MNTNEHGFLMPRYQADGKVKEKSMCSKVLKENLAMA
jgi:hypothetical protein